MKRASILSTMVVFLLVQGVAQAFFSVIEDSADLFEVVFDNDNGFLVFNPVGGTGDEYVELFMGGESAAIAISTAFRDSATDALNDFLFVFEFIAGDPVFPGPHLPGDVLVFNETDFSTGAGLLAGFDRTKLTVTVGETREDPFSAQLVLSKDKVPVPESASTAMLLGMVLVGLASHRLRTSKP